MLRYFVSRHFALWPRRLSNGKTIWFKPFYTVQRFQSEFGDVLITQEEYATLSEKGAKDFKLFLDSSQLIKGVTTL